MDAVQDRELDTLIAAVDDEAPEEDASTDESEPDTRETAEPDDSSEDESGNVDEGEGEEEDGEEPDAEDAEVEINPADLTPIQAAPANSGSLSELAELRQQVNELQGFRTQAQQDNERREFAGFLESLKGMDPDDRKDAVATRIAQWAMGLQNQLNERNARDAQAAEAQAEAEAQNKALQFIAMGGRRVGDRFVAKKSLQLTDREAERLARAAARGMSPEGLEEFATDMVNDRLAANGAKRAQKQQADSKNGASRTLAGAGAAKKAPKTYTGGEESLDDFLDDQLG